MDFKQYMSTELRNLYDEVINGLNDSTLEIIMKQPYFSNSVASYIHDEKGNYKIYINPNFYTEYIFSHELLHVYIGIKNIVPVLTSFNHDDEEISKYLAIMLNDVVQHRWIIEEQRRRNIKGEEEFINEFISNLINNEYIESNKVSEDFNMINTLYTFMNDYPNYIGKLEEYFDERYSFSMKYAKELFHEQSKYDLTSPFYARRYIIKAIDMWIEWLYKEDYDCKYLKREICVKPVFSEQQKGARANATVGIDKCGNMYYLYTNVGLQKCSPNFTANINSLKQGRDMLSKKTLGQLINEIKLPHYTR